MNSDTNDCYKIPALAIEDGIPIFSQTDFYIENYDKISYDHVSAITSDSENPWITEKVWNEMEVGTLQLVLKYLEGNSNKRILDVGVGMGRLLGKIKEDYPGQLELYGVDISSHYLRLAHSKGLNVAMVKNEDMPYKNEYFDMITCTDVLEHVEDLNLCVRKIIDCLKPGGIFIVRVPNREDLSSYLNPDYPYDLAHVRGFDEYSLELLFTRIFRQELLEKAPGLLIVNAALIKYKLPFKGYHFLVINWLRMLKKMSNKWHDWTIEKLYYPTEINMVLRKPKDE